MESDSKPIKRHDSNSYI
uniref:Uncharacterized protein n=1 Tax=Rhizophora mucronata TaxID=61149 RepID=A0A2P2NWB5_RHIMU